MQAKAVSYIAIGCIFIAFGPFFVEFAGVEATTSSFYRLVIGAVSFLIISRIRNEELPQARFLWLYFLAGLMTTLDLVACNQSILYIGSGLSTILSNIEVFFLLLIGFMFFKEKLPRHFLSMCLFIVLGIYCLMQPYLSEMHPNFIYGSAFALTASFIYSLYLLLLKMISKNNPASTAATTLGVVCSFGTVILGTYIYLQPSETFYLPYDWKSISCIVSYSLISQVLGWWFITNGLKHVSLSVSGVIFLTQPALTFLCDCLFIGRNTHLIQILGGIILLFTVYLTVREENQAEATA